MMVITDLVYEDIRLHIASHPPERGGALYGPRSYPFVTHFEFDPDANTTAVSYVPSSKLIANVKKVEIETGLQFKGIIHSHPRGFSRPSGGDEQTVASFFRLNPQHSVMALPIVQQLGSHNFGQNSEFLHWYRAERRGETMAQSGFSRLLPPARTKPVEILPEEFYVVPINEHVKKILAHLQTKGLSLTSAQRIQAVKMHNAELIGLVATSSQGYEFMYFVSLDYPIVAPIVLYQRNNETENLRFHWDGISNVEESLSEIAELLFDEWGKPSKLFLRRTDANLIR